MKLTPSTVDVLLSTLDQQAPVTGRPLGRLKSLVNGKMTRYENPRAADGTVTHVRVEKRDGLTTATNLVVDGQGNPDGVLEGDPQLVFGGGDALRQVAGNRLFTKANKWVKAIDPTGADAVVFPHVVRSTSVYAADSQAEAPDISILGDVTCLVWREIAQQSTANGDQAAANTTSSALDGVRVMFRDVSGTTVRPPFTLTPTPGKSYNRVRTYAYDGVFWVLQDWTSAAATVQIDVSCFDTNGVELAVLGIAPVTNNFHWDAVTINGEGVVVAFNANGAGVKFTALRYAAGVITPTTNTDASISCQTVGPCAWLTDQAMTANTGYLVTGVPDDGATDLTAFRIVSLAQDHIYPLVAVIGSGVWISAVAGYKDPLSTGLVVAFTLMDFLGLPEYATYGASASPTLSGQNPSASDQYPDQLNNETHTWAVPFTGTSIGIQTRYAMSLASRAFAVGADWCAWGYYPARKWGPLTPAAVVGNAPTPPGPSTHCPNRPADPSNFQPCWYLLPLASTQRIAGRLEYGLASADYQVMQANTATQHPAVSAILGVRNRCLMHVVTTGSGALMLPLGYRAEQNIPEAALLSQQVTPDVGQTQIVNNTFATNQLIYSAGDTIGIKVFTMGPDFGQAFTCNQSTFMPGAMAAVVEPGEVTISEHGILAPECPWVSIGSNVVAPPTGSEGAWFYRAVGEYTTSRGKVYRSIPSAAFAFSLVAGTLQDQIVGGHNLNATNKPFVKWSIYRTSFTTAQVQGGSQVTSPPTAPSGPPPATATINNFTTIFYKITNDLAPLYNDPGAKYIAGATAPYGGFDDTIEIATQLDGEVLYTDQGLLPRFPAPAHRGGCVWQNRPWLIGYDNALWFGGELVEGQGEWFNPGFRVPTPTNEEITAVAPMDGFLLVFCSNSVWYYPGGAPLPDATGQNGTIQPLIRLPFEMGCANGHTSVIREGCIYDSSNGGVWMITRALDNTWVGQRAQDDLAPNVIGMTIAGNFVVVNVAASENYVMAYDTNLGAWSKWILPTNGAVIGATFGNLVAAENGKVWVQKPGTWDDVDTIVGVSHYVPLSFIVAPVHIGGVRSWKRTWAIQLEGETFDPSSMTVVLVYGDYDTPSHTYQPVALVAGPLEEEYRPTKQLASSVQIGVADSQPLTRIATIEALAPPAGPLFWYKADAGVTANGSNQVSEWADQTVNHFDMLPQDSGGTTQPTSSWPVLTPNAINGRAAMLYNGSSTLLQCIFPNGTTNKPSPDGAPVQVAAVVKANGNGGTICTLRLNNDDLEFDIFNHLGETQIFCSAQDARNMRIIPPDSSLFGVNLLAAWQFYGAGVAPVGAFQANGVSKTLGTSSSPITNYSGNSGFSIGYVNAVFGRVFNGYIGEVIGYLGTDPTVAAAALAYLKAKWGL